MASIACDPGGKKRILVACGDGPRKTIRLGSVSQRNAEAIKVRVEQLATAKLTGIMDPEAARWVGSLEDKMYAKLAAAGLVPPRDRQHPTLGRLLSAFFDTVAVKPQTAVTYKQTRTAMEKFFGEARRLSTIETLDGDRWRQAMREEGLAEATISKRIKTGRQILRQGIKWKMLAENPLEGVKAGSQSNASRMFFISQEDSAKVLDACPNVEWKLLFALSRIGGLRCPSEHLRLKWEHVDWARGRILVSSPKTEAHAGRDSRIIPMFPELRALLMEAFEAAEPGGEWVIARYRDPTCNLRSQFIRILHRAGLKPWPRLFHNLRGSRQTELAAKHPIHVVCAWLGNTQAVAQTHYLQLRDSDFEDAIREVAAPHAAQKAAQHAAARGCTEAPAALAIPPETRGLLGVAAPCGAVQVWQMTPAA